MLIPCNHWKVQALSFPMLGPDTTPKGVHEAKKKWYQVLIPVVITVE